MNSPLLKCVLALSLLIGMSGDVIAVEDGRRTPCQKFTIALAAIVSFGGLLTVGTSAQEIVTSREVDAYLVSPSLSVMNSTGHTIYNENLRNCTTVIYGGNFPVPVEYLPQEISAKAGSAFAKEVASSGAAHMCRQVKLFRLPDDAGLEKTIETSAKVCLSHSGAVEAFGASTKDCLAHKHKDKQAEKDL
jgi:hypothetical protein